MAVWHSIVCIYHIFKRWDHLGQKVSLTETSPVLYPLAFRVLRRPRGRLGRGAADLAPHQGLQAARAAGALGEEGACRQGFSRETQAAFLSPCDLGFSCRQLPGWLSSPETPFPEEDSGCAFRSSCGISGGEGYIGRLGLT